MQKALLAQFQTPDGLLLPGLLYEPAKKTDRVAIVLHGNGSSSVFYSYLKNLSFSEELLKRGIAYFPFNNRGAHYIKKLTQVTEAGEVDVKVGTTYELIKDCLYDIDGAIDFLAGKGYREFYLLGYSTGANKICVYNYYRPENRVKKYVLLGGGDDTGVWYSIIGNRTKFFRYLEKAKEEIDKGRGDKFIPRYMLPYLFSYRALYDTLNPDGDYNVFPFNEYANNLQLSNKELFREFRSIRKPTLVVYGEMDEYCYGDVEGAVETLKKVAPKKVIFEFKILKGADHGFTGHEEELAKAVAGWLNKA